MKKLAQPISKPRDVSGDGHVLPLGRERAVRSDAFGQIGRSGIIDGARPVSDQDVVRDRVVVSLLELGIVSKEDIRAARGRAGGDDVGRLWRQLAEVPGVDREAVYRQAARTYAFREMNLDEFHLDREFVRLFMEQLPKAHRERLTELRVVPVGYESESRRASRRIIFIASDPTHPRVQEAMQALRMERLELRYAPEALVDEVLFELIPRRNEFLERVSEHAVAIDVGPEYEDEDELVDQDALEAEISRSVLINLVEAALVEAVRQGASDLHIYPNAERHVEIRFRIDGRLTLWHVEKKVHPEALLAVIKDSAAGVDRFERDVAQDGYIQRHIDGTLIRFRVSVLPIASARQDLRAESVVIRVLDDRKVITDLNQLGLLRGALDRFDRAIRQPHGMVILTGPTGSGKSTTLVAALHQVVTPEVNVLTVEDPVEYIIPGVRQIKLGHKLDLEQALRAILRHDPDIVMVGEMRDRDTAELAIKLANTGHLTFSTLHTNDAPSAVSRLYKMGIEPFLIAYAINLVVAQRLVRRLCPDCKLVDDAVDSVLTDRLGFDLSGTDANTVIYRPGSDKDCETCGGSGYKGRRAISETLYFSPSVRQLIVEAEESVDEDEIRRLAIREGMLTLIDSAREVVRMGETSLEEMMRVVFTE